MAIKMNKYMELYVFILCLFFKFGAMLKYEKPVAESIWKQPCTKHQSILNDCNWCRCSQSRYACDARVCTEVDMFGHFNDAIKEIDVGMEGHGVWRSDQTACSPGVEYQRGELLCICSKSGNWPSPVCRDTFRVLHPVEIVTDVKAFKDHECVPAKLYLIGCNVCFCPADGVPNPKFCTRKTCSKEDPVFEHPKKKSEVVEVYAECKLDKQYKLGCKDCTCLRNNRMICNNCTIEESHCSNKEPGEMFNLDCNICQCDEKGLMFCTAKRCLKDHVTSKDVIEDEELKSVDAPLFDVDCIQGTKYKKDCNTCFCFKRHGIKKFGCTLKTCSKTDSSNDCVDGTIYELDCLICQCATYSGKKMQMCQEDPKCKKQGSKNLKYLSDLSGYCEPLHFYKKDCNTCKCLPDGKTVHCTANNCQKEIVSSQSQSKLTSYKYEPNLKPIEVEIVPVMKDLGKCSRGTTFKIDCNICFCLLSGDVVCTTEECKKRMI